MQRPRLRHEKPGGLSVTGSVSRFPATSVPWSSRTRSAATASAGQSSTTETSLMSVRLPISLGTGSSVVERRALGGFSLNVIQRRCLALVMNADLVFRVNGLFAFHFAEEIVR